MKHHQRFLPENCEPFAVSHEEAAALWGVGTTMFDKLVNDRIAPKPLRIGGRVLWDLHALKRAWKKFADANGEPEVNPWDEYLKNEQTRVTPIRAQSGKGPARKVAYPLQET